MIPTAIDSEWFIEIPSKPKLVAERNIMIAAKDVEPWLLSLSK
jgi:hypothetical protein